MFLFSLEHKIHKIENIHYIPLFEESKEKKIMSLEQRLDLAKIEIDNLFK